MHAPKYQWPVLCLIHFAIVSQAEVTEVDLEMSATCDRQDPIIITDDDVVIGVLRARRRAVRRTSCMIKVSTTKPRRIIVKTKYLGFNGCGDRINIYDQNRFKKDPLYSLDCSARAETVYETKVSTAMVIYTKSYAETTSEIEFWIMTDNSEWLSKKSWGRGLNRRDTRSTLTAGAIAGITVSVLLVICLFIGLGVYCYRFRKQASLHSYS